MLANRLYKFRDLHLSIWPRSLLLYFTVPERRFVQVSAFACLEFVHECVCVGLHVGKRRRAFVVFLLKGNNFAKAAGYFEDSVLRWTQPLGSSSFSSSLSRGPSNSSHQPAHGPHLFSSSSSSSGFTSACSHPSRPTLVSDIWVKSRT